MDNQRLLIWAIFAFLAWITYQTWVADYAPKPTPAVTEQDGATQTELGSIPGDEELPALSDNGADDALPSTPDIAPEPETQARAPTVTVSTDVFDIVISTAGGTLQSAVLKKYPVHKDHPDVLVSLLDTANENYGLIESGVRAAGGAAEATHLAQFAASRGSYALGDADEIVVPLTWTDESGIAVEKRFRFSRGSYEIGLEQVITNGSAEPWRGAEYVRIKRRSVEMERSMFDVDSYSFTGPIVYDGDKSEKLKRDDLIEDGKREFTAQRGWMGTIQHHFLSAVVPTPDTDYKYDIGVTGNVATSSVIRRSLATVAPGSSETFATTLFVGPKLQEQLEEIDKSLKLTVDYGWLTIISQPLFWLLSVVYGYVRNWGVAIILVTFLIKLAFYKLTEVERTLDGQDAPDSAAHEGAAGSLQGRQAGAQPGHDGALQAREGQPGRRLPAHPDPDAVLPRVLLGVARKRRNAPGAVRTLDHRPVDPRSLLYPAADHGRRHVRPAEAEPGTGRPGAGQGDADHAGHVHGLLCVLPVRPGALLGNEHPAVDRAAVEGQQGRRSRVESTKGQQEGQFVAT